MVLEKDLCKPSTIEFIKKTLLPATVILRYVPTSGERKCPKKVKWKGDTVQDKMEQIYCSQFVLLSDNQKPWTLDSKQNKRTLMERR